MSSTVPRETSDTSYLQHSIVVPSDHPPALSRAVQTAQEVARATVVSNDSKAASNVARSPERSRTLPGTASLISAVQSNLWEGQQHFEQYRIEQAIGLQHQSRHYRIAESTLSQWSDQHAFASIGKSGFTAALALTSLLSASADARSDRSEKILASISIMALLATTYKQLQPTRRLQLHTSGQNGFKVDDTHHSGSSWFIGLSAYAALGTFAMVVAQIASQAWMTNNGNSLIMLGAALVVISLVASRSSSRQIPKVWIPLSDKPSPYMQTLHIASHVCCSALDKVKSKIQGFAQAVSNIRCRVLLASTGHKHKSRNTKLTMPPRQVDSPNNRIFIH